MLYNSHCAKCLKLPQSSRPQVVISQVGFRPPRLNQHAVTRLDSTEWLSFRLDTENLLVSSRKRAVWKKMGLFSCDNYVENVNDVDKCMPLTHNIKML